MLALAVGAFVSFTVRRSFPQLSGSAELRGLGAPVSVQRDAHGIPQIYADTAEDLFRPRATCTRRTGSGRWTSAGT